MESTYLDLITEFTNFLSSSDHDLKSKLRHLSRVTLKQFQINQAHFVQLTEDDSLLFVARFGMSVQELVLQSQHSAMLYMDYPACVALRKNKIVWINTLPNWGVEYPILRNWPVNPEDKLNFCVPVYQNEIPTAVLVFKARYCGNLNSEIEDFLRAISSIFSLYHFRKIKVSSEVETIHLNIPNKIGHKNQEDHELTERQHIILRLISEERTNQSISEFLGYSESTVRQEIMKIFDKLGCSRRSEAAAIYRNSELINK